MKVGLLGLLCVMCVDVADSDAALMLNIDTQTEEFYFTGTDTGTPVGFGDISWSSAGSVDFDDIDFNTVFSFSDGKTSIYNGFAVNDVGVEIALFVDSTEAVTITGKGSDSRLSYSYLSPSQKSVFESATSIPLEDGMGFSSISVQVEASSSDGVGMTLDWERDLSAYISEGDNNVTMQQLFDGTICVAIYAFASPADILVYDSSGVEKLHDTIPMVEDFEFQMISFAPNQFAFETWNGVEGETLWMYEFQNGSYTSTNLTHVEYAGSEESAINTGFLYIVQDSKLKKFILDSAPAVVNGAVASGIDGSNYILNWNSELNGQYQIQSSTTLTNWIDVGGVITGTGEPITWANALTNSKSFYRVIKQ